MMQAISTFWPIFTGAIGTLVCVVVWFVRLEGRVNAHSAKVEILEKKHDQISQIIAQVGRDISAIKEGMDWMKMYFAPKNDHQ